MKIYRRFLRFDNLQLSAGWKHFRAFELNEYLVGVQNPV